MKSLHIFNKAYKKYYDNFCVYAQDKPDPYNLDIEGGLLLPAIAEQYDSVHFWEACKLETMEAIHATSTIVSFTSPFGRKIFNGWEKPFDLQFHVSRTALANYVNADNFSWRCENTVSYLPVRTEVFDSSKYDRESIRSKMGYQPGDLVICRSGRADVWKWDMFLVELLTRMRGEVKALIVGGVPNFIERALESRDLMDIVKIIPYDDYTSSIHERNAELLAASDLYVHSSFIGESCGMSILEAMSMKKPVIVLNTPWADNAPAEYIEPGANGYLVDTVDEAARIIEMGTKERWAEMGEKGREVVLQRFEASKVVRRMEDAIHNTSKSRRVDGGPKSDAIKKMAFAVGVQRRRHGLV